MGSVAIMPLRERDELRAHLGARHVESNWTPLPGPRSVQGTAASPRGGGG
jgi:hypothetical protein